MFVVDGKRRRIAQEVNFLHFAARYVKSGSLAQVGDELVMVSRFDQLDSLVQDRAGRCIAQPDRVFEYKEQQYDGAVDELCAEVVAVDDRVVAGAEQGAVVVVGGSIAGSWDLLVEPLSDSLHPWTDAALVQASLEEHTAALIGAADAAARLLPDEPAARTRPLN